MSFAPSHWPGSGGPKMPNQRQRERSNWTPLLLLPGESSRATASKHHTATDTLQAFVGNASDQTANRPDSMPPSKREVTS